MNRKGKIVFLCIMSFTLCGCGNTEVASEHTHTYSDTYFSDEEFHWHFSTCGHPDQISDKGKHIDDDRDAYCDVCSRFDVKAKMVSSEKFSQIMNGCKPFNLIDRGTITYSCLNEDNLYSEICKFSIDGNKAKEELLGGKPIYYECKEGSSIVTYSFNDETKSYELKITSLGNLLNVILLQEALKYEDFYFDDSTFKYVTYVDYHFFGKRIDKIELDFLYNRLVEIHYKSEFDECKYTYSYDSVEVVLPELK